MRSMKNLIKKIPFVPDIYRKIRDTRLANRKAAATPFGFKMIGSAEMQRGEFEKADTKVFRRFLKDIDVVIDAGAHFGYYCLQALALKKHLIAFEPMNTKVLLKNISLNGWENDAEVFPLALTERPGILKMYGGGTGASLLKGWAGASSGKPVLVPASSLDLVLGNRLSGKRVLVLIDVEGSEYDLLRGAKTLLRSEPRPIWMVEITRTTHRPKGSEVNPNYLKTFEMFWEAGYDVYRANEKGELKHYSKEEIAEGREERANDFFSNYVFAHKTAGALASGN